MKRSDCVICQSFCYCLDIRGERLCDSSAITLQTAMIGDNTMGGPVVNRGPPHIRRPTDQNLLSAVAWDRSQRGVRDKGPIPRVDPHLPLTITQLSRQLISHGDDPLTIDKTQLIRLQKVLAEAGVGSRRECEELISEGRVDVDREVVTQLGTKVDPGSQAIRVDGIPLKRKQRRYFAVHKPPGVLSTSKDQWRRARVIDLVASKDRLFTIGRLDKESSGLILVTNDGDLANKLTHPRYGVQKTYEVTVAGIPTPEVIQKLRRGVVLSDGRVKPESLVIKKRLKQSAMLEIVLTEGRNREIRRMLARFEHKVMKLRRVAMGPIRLGSLPVGAHRELTRAEVNRLRLSDGGDKKVAAKKKGNPRPKSKAGVSKAGVKKSGVAKKGAGGKSTKKPVALRSTPKTGSIIGGHSDAGEKKKTRKRKR